MLNAPLTLPSSLPIAIRDLAPAAGLTFVTSLSEFVHVQEGTLCQSSYSWSTPISATQKTELLEVLSKNEGGLFKYLDPMNNYASATPIIHGRVWVGGAILVAGVHHLPVLVWGYSTGSTKKGRHLYIKPVPFLVGNTLNIDGTDYTYNPYQGYIDNPPAELQTNTSPFNPVRYRSFQDTTDSTNLIPATFNFYTPVKVTSVDTPLINKGVSLVACPETDMFNLSMRAEEEVKLNTLYLLSSHVTATSPIVHNFVQQGLVYNGTANGNTVVNDEFFWFIYREDATPGGVYDPNNMVATVTMQAAAICVPVEELVVYLAVRQGDQIYAYYRVLLGTVGANQLNTSFTFSNDPSVAGYKDTNTLSTTSDWFRAVDTNDNSNVAAGNPDFTVTGGPIQVGILIRHTAIVMAHSEDFTITSIDVAF